MGYATLLAVGQTGAGKSSLLNRYLQSSKFTVSSSADAVTAKAKVETAVIGEVRRAGIDTVGLAAGDAKGNEAIRSMFKVVRDWKAGVNAVVLVFNVQNDRFSEATKNTIGFAYHCFGADVLNNLCVVFTHCHASMPGFPNRERKATEWRSRLQAFLRELSGAAAPTIPIHFVDNEDWRTEDKTETNQSLKALEQFARDRRALVIRKFDEIREDGVVRVEEGAEAVKRHDREGTKTYAVYGRQRREVIVPFSGGAPRLGDWVWAPEERRELEREEKVERKARVLQRDYESGGSYYHEYVDQVRTVVEERGCVTSVGEWQTERGPYSEWYGSAPVREVVRYTYVPAPLAPAPLPTVRYETYWATETYYEEVPLYEYCYQYRSDRTFWNPSPRYGSCCRGRGTAKEADAAKQRAYNSVDSSHYPYHAVECYRRRAGTRRVPKERSVQRTRAVFG